MNSFLIWIARIFGTPLSLGIIDFPFDLTTLLLQLVLPTAGSVVVYKLLLMGVRRMIGSIPMKERSAQAAFRWTRLAARALLIVLWVFLIGRLFGARVFEYARIFSNALNQPIISSGSTKISLVTLFLIVPVFYIASWAGRGTKNLLDARVLDRLGLDDDKRFAAASLLRYGVMVLVVLLGLSVLGIDLTALTVIFGVLGLGVGFGLQSVVANFFSGLVIIISRPIRDNDRVRVDGHEGTVIQIRLLSTVITTLTNETIIVPNTHLVSNTVYNDSYADRSVVIRNNVSVAYDSDLDRVIAVLRSVGESCPYRHGGDVTVRVKEFLDSGIDLALLTTISDVKGRYDAHSWVNLEIWRQFREKGVEIPFPQVVVHRD